MNLKKWKRYVCCKFHGLSEYVWYVGSKMPLKSSKTFLVCYITDRIFQNPSLRAKMRLIRLRILCWSRLFGREWQIHSLSCLTFTYKLYPKRVDIAEWCILRNPTVNLTLLYNYVTTFFFQTHFSLKIFIPPIQIDYADFKKNCFETFRLQKNGEISIKSIFSLFFDRFSPKIPNF